MNKRVVPKGNLIKETNYKKILKLIGTGQNLTKLDIAYTLKISIPTVTTNINEMKQEGIIDEVESDIYTGGRKPKLIKIIPNARVSIGVSITKSKVIVVVMNLVEDILAIKEYEVNSDRFEGYLEAAHSGIRHIINELGIDEETILGIGISIPGTLNMQCGVIEQTNIGFGDIALDRVYDQFNTTVYVENEANLSLLAEQSIRKQDDIKNLLYIGINEGLGGGILVNGELFTGTCGRAGEFGHMHFVDQMTGERYCIEDKIATLGLVKEYNQVTGNALNDFAAFEKEVKKGNQMAKEILAKGIDIFIMTMYNLTMVLDIQRIIIGGKVGRLIKSQPDLLNEIMKAYESVLANLDLQLEFSEMRHTSATGASLLPLIDFYKVSNEIE